ncbi:MAG TPA: hypothetical protein VFB34_10510 [Chloroflexota bacterium]|nr:hypothetical protein [Chloroflexota bacterium]
MRNLLAAGAMGLATAGRSLTPLALISWTIRSGRLPSEGLTTTLFGHRRVSQLLVFGAAIELILDKLPMTPDRVSHGADVYRALLGGLAGTLITDRGKLPNRLAGGLCGAVAAFAASHILLAARRGFTDRGLPDPAIALAEDGLVLATVHHFLKQSRATN